jgi:hypothetical protein
MSVVDIPNRRAGLSKGALEWMLDEAESKGLLVEADKCREILRACPSAARNCQGADFADDHR